MPFQAGTIVHNWGPTNRNSHLGQLDGCVGVHNETRSMKDIINSSAWVPNGFSTRIFVNSISVKMIRKGAK